MEQSDELFYQAIDLLKSLIATPSTSRQEDRAADIVESHMRRCGMAPRRHGNNVWAIAPGFDPSKPTVLLNSHIDTVKPADGWTRDPYSPTEEPGPDGAARIYGLGSNDAGASVVSLLATFSALSAMEQPYNLVMLASCEEEVSGRNGLESVIPMLPSIDLAIVGEPTGMKPAISEKGLMVIDAEIHGRAGHAAREEGVNAIYKAIPVIEALRAMRFPKESATLGPVKISVTQIEAGSQHNVVPALCRMVIDVRTTDAYTNVETLEMMRDALTDCDLTPRSVRLNPSGIAESHPLVRRLKMMGLEPFGSPTLSDQALMPWPSLKMGPVESSRSHTADEYIRPDEIRQALAIYFSALNGLVIQ